MAQLDIVPASVVSCSLSYVRALPYTVVSRIPFVKMYNTNILFGDSVALNGFLCFTQLLKLLVVKYHKYTQQLNFTQLFVFDNKDDSTLLHRSLRHH